MLLLVVACAASPPAPPPPPPPVVGLELGTVLADAAAVPATAGTWLGHSEETWSLLITREHTESGRVAVDTRLTLAEDGGVSGCTAWSSRDSSSISKYASHDGQHHRDERTDAGLVVFAGSWALQEGWAVIDASIAWGETCDTVIEEGAHLAMRCVGITGLPAPALACTTDGPYLAERGLPVGVLGEREAGRVQRWAGARWLIVGAEPGLALAFDQGRRSAPTLEAKVAPVTVRKP